MAECPENPTGKHSFFRGKCLWCFAPELEYRGVKVAGLPPPDKLNFSKSQIEDMHRVTQESILSGKEMGFNILGDLKNPKFGQIYTGYKNILWIPKVITSIGTFHTHPNARARFGMGDVISALMKRQSIICIGGKSIKKKNDFSEVVCYVADPSSKGYGILLKKLGEYGSALSVGNWDYLNLIGKEIYEQGQKTFNEKYDYGVKMIGV